ncbi:MAG: CPBP family intramembrane metalloprotease [Coriobacteriia bacterium]|nr:CPBP family intramembrane metalloprotease [Coriobacteriia bacterium]
MHDAPQSRVWGALGFAFLYALVFALAQLLASIAIFGFIAIDSGTRAIANGSLDLNDPNATEAFVAALIDSHLTTSVPWILLASGLITLLVCWLIVKRRGFSPLQHAGMRATTPVVLLSALVLGIGFSLVFDAIFSLPALESIHDPATVQRQSLLFGSILTAIIASTIVPIAEEIIFRGYILSEMRRGMPLLPAVLLSSAIFGVFHGTAMWALMAMGMGLLFAWVALRARSVYASIMTHVGVNATSFIFVWLKPSGSQTFLLLIAVGAAIIIGAAIVFLRNTQKEQE